MTCGKRFADHLTAKNTQSADLILQLDFVCLESANVRMSENSAYLFPNLMKAHHEDLPPLFRRLSSVYLMSILGCPILNAADLFDNLEKINPGTDPFSAIIWQAQGFATDNQIYELNEVTS